MEAKAKIDEFFDKLASEKKDLNMNSLDLKLSEGYETGKQEEIISIKEKLSTCTKVSEFFSKFNIYYTSSIEGHRKDIKYILDVKNSNDDISESELENLDMEQGRVTSKIDVLNETKAFLGSLNSEIAKDDLMGRGVLDTIIADNLKRVEEEDKND